MQIITGKQPKAQRVVLYGPEGIGKTTFASQFPNPLFIDTEGSTDQLDVARAPRPSSWTMFKQLLGEFMNDQMGYKTLVIDTVDWAEHMCSAHICAQGDKNGPKEGIEDFGYGKGYTYVAEEFAKALNYLTGIREQGVHIVLLAHAYMRKFEQPDEMGAYDRWELKLSKKCAPLVKEWADMVLFANYRTLVVDVDGKKKAQGGQRVINTAHHPCWDAKNRHSLPEEVPLAFSSISQALAEFIQSDATQTIQQNQEPAAAAQTATEVPVPVPNVPNTKLADLMVMHGITENDIQIVVADRGYYPSTTPIENYDPTFIEGVLIAAWDKVYNRIQQLKGNVA